MFRSVTFVVLLVVTCNHALPSLSRLEFRSVLHDIENDETAQLEKSMTDLISQLEKVGGIALSVLEKMPNLYNSLGKEALEDDASEHELTYNDKNGYYPGHRGKRAIRRILSLVPGAKFLKGLWVTKTLLKGLKPILKFKIYTTYIKRADFKQMVKDFWSVNPTNVHDYVVYGHTVGKTGMVGDRKITYNAADNWLSGPKITITKMDKHGNDIYSDYITYDELLGFPYKGKTPSD